MIPSFVSFFVSLFKDTSIAYIIGVVELVQSGVIVSQRQPNRMYAAYLCVALGFWVVSFSISQFAMMLEKRLGKLELESIRFGNNG
jgi:ABC-type amino acid transport system permease subunit